MYKKLLLTISLFFLLVIVFSQNKNSKIFTEITSLNKAIYGKNIVAKKSKLYYFDLSVLKNKLKNASYKNQTIKDKNEIFIKLPHPDENFYNYKIYRNTTMSEGLAQKFPKIRTYDAVCITNPSITVKIDITLKGFHAMIMQNGKSTIYIDPY